MLKMVGKILTKNEFEQLPNGTVLIVRGYRTLFWVSVKVNKRGDLMVHDSDRSFMNLEGDKSGFACGCNISIAPKWIQELF